MSLRVLWLRLPLTMSILGSDFSPAEALDRLQLTRQKKIKVCRLEENIPGGIFISKRTRRTFSQEFKQQIVNIYLAGKPRVEIIREYELTASAFDKWVKAI